MRYVGALIAVLLVSFPCLAQEEEAAQTPVEAQPEEESSIRPSAALETINRILEADADAQTDAALGYDPGGRRDPFLSLLSPSNVASTRGPRPEGVRGLLIDDLTLRGVFVTPEGGVAQVQASNKTASYLLRKGDRLYDGEVVAIRFAKNELAEVVFKQGVQDPAAIMPFREVVKKITP